MGVPLKFRLNLDVADDVWGIEAGIGRGDENAPNRFWVYNAHGWVDPIEMLKIRAGLIDPGIWGIGGEIDTNLANGLGIRFELSPMEGLSLGVFLGDGSNGDPEQLLETYFKNMTAFGFSYAQEDLFEVSAAFRLLYDESNVGDEEDGEMIIGLGFYGVENLSVYVGVHMTNLINDADVGTRIALDVGYDVTDQIWVGLLADLSMGTLIYEMDDGFGNVINVPVEDARTLILKPKVSFAATEDITVGAELPVLLDFTEDAEVFSGIGLDLWGQYNIGNSWIKAGYGFAFTPEDANYATGEAIVDHYIKLVFGFSF